MVTSPTRQIVSRPLPYDSELLKTLLYKERLPIPSNLEELLQVRQDERSSEAEATRIDAIRSDPAIYVEAIRVPGPLGDIPVLVLHPKAANHPGKPKPAIIFYHGGGMVKGTAYFSLAAVTDAVKDVDAVIFSVDYRLAPENHGSALVEDCYAALLWVAGHSSEFGLDMSRFMVAGVSAGGGLAAGTALLARDRKGPALCAQLLVCPMLDDRLNTTSALQYEGARGFYTAWGRYAWSCVLGEKTGTGSVSPYPNIDAGAAEPFRDEDVAYASRLWQSGIRADLHIWGGGCHGFDLFEAPTALGATSSRTRREWLNRTLS
ncbi:Alpha/Beta hydrolase protein [Colletotrichum phormii]|uniref:Alpha/Beta hydrolase protein n=1 Tax=Colletotrichum phormii TaxID=359342 RepID=A0AAJ0ED27_9PEZI|nr:Alpha/Beta hydrolase protein [Colletotrichum phormii]KAK1625278.1 Alpha/Beta hydrolase protein [Colletotrichum phormii]